MKETIADVRKRYVFKPKDPLPNVEKDSYLRGHNDGWNAALNFVKAGGLK